MLRAPATYGGASADFLSILDTNIMCEAIFPCLERLTDIVNLSHTSKHLRLSIFCGRTSTIWSSCPLDICIDPLCTFGCGRVSIKPSLAWLILRSTSIVTVRVHLPFSSLCFLLKAILENKLKTLRHVHLRFRIDDDSSSVASMLSLDREVSSIPIRRINVGHLTIYGYPSTYVPTGALDTLLQVFGMSLKTLQLMETSPVYLLSMLRMNVCPNLTNLTIQGQQLIEGLLDLQCDSLRSLSLLETGIRLGRGRGKLSIMQFPNLVKLELVDKMETTNQLWRTEQDIVDGISVLPTSLRELELRIDSRLANVAIIELGRRLQNLEDLRLQLPDRDELGPDDISFSAIAALKHGCPRLSLFETTDGLIGFDVDAFISMKDFRCLRKLKVLYDDNIVDALPKLLEESSSNLLDDIQFYENAGEILEDDGASRWNTMEERLLKISAIFTCVNISLSDCEWT